MDFDSGYFHFWNFFESGIPGGLERLTGVVKAIFFRKKGPWDFWVIWLHICGEKTPCQNQRYYDSTWTLFPLLLVMAWADASDSTHKT